MMQLQILQNTEGGKTPYTEIQHIIVEEFEQFNDNSIRSVNILNFTTSKLKIHLVELC